jgi:bifunctional DNA-binding transcriptional regulator/antitoxin component of YhaV-PrlF toxin-antitoxin module
VHKLTTKRQVTLPQTVCQAIALQPGDYVEVFARDGVAHIVKMKSDNLAGKFNYMMKDKEFLSMDDINNAVKKQAAKKFLANDYD